MYLSNKGEEWVGRHFYLVPNNFIESEAKVISEMYSSWALKVLQQERCLVSHTYDMFKVVRDKINEKTRSTFSSRQNISKLKKAQNPYDKDS